MRSPVIGAAFATDTPRRQAFVRLSTRLTHTDPRAETAARFVAETVAALVRGEDGTGAELPGEDPEWQRIVGLARRLLDSDASVSAFAAALGLERGVTGYAYHTVPVAWYAWRRHRGDFAATLTHAIRCGGDTDTVGAVAGALAGAEVGSGGIPPPWLEGLADWPRTPRRLREVARRLANGGPSPVAWFWPGVLPRNLLFLALVLAHGARRLLPPYR